MLMTDLKLNADLSCVTHRVKGHIQPPNTTLKGLIK